MESYLLNLNGQPILAKSTNRGVVYSIVGQAKDVPLNDMVHLTEDQKKRINKGLGIDEK